MPFKTDHEAQLHYFEFLNDHLLSSWDTLRSAYLRFFSAALLFFILLQFGSTVRILGTEVNVPGLWIVSLAPIVLAYLLHAIGKASLDFTIILHKTHEMAPDVLSRPKWKFSKEDWRIFSKFYISMFSPVRFWGEAPGKFERFVAHLYYLLLMIFWVIVPVTVVLAYMYNHRVVDPETAYLSSLPTLTIMAMTIYVTSRANKIGKQVSS